MRSIVKSVAKIVALVAVLSLPMAGCLAKVQVGGHSLYADEWARYSEDIKRRAAFELKCPAEQIQLQVLATNPFNDAIPNQVGADGCGQRLVYVRTPSGFVLNSKGADAK